MTVAAMDVIVTDSPRTERMDRDALQAMVKRLESSGGDSSFYVGVLSKMDAYEQTLSAKTGRPQPAPAPGALKPTPS